MQPIETVGIISKPGVETARRIVPELLEWLAARGLKARLDAETAEYVGGRACFARENVPVGAQLVIVLGGDGTLLGAARAIGGREVPLFAVNLGGLGFLTAISVEEIYPELERALNNEHRVAHRRMLSCRIVRGGKVAASYEALNDAVLTKASLARMIDVEVRIDLHFVSRFRADGLIIATPTGSTAYSLSAGGPIIFPSVECLGITPICPHTLTHRPVIVPDSNEIVLTNRAPDGEAYLTIDGQVGEPLLEGDEVHCARSGNTLCLIRPPRALFFDVLRQKLKWGVR